MKINIKKNHLKYKHRTWIDITDGHRHMRKLPASLITKEMLTETTVRHHLRLARMVCIQMAKDNKRR